MAKQDTLSAETPQALTPLDYQKLLTPPSKDVLPRDADFWRKEKDGRPATPWIIRHQAVQKLARLFGVTVVEVRWPSRDLEKTRLTCEVVVTGYAPLSRAQCGVGLSGDYPVPALTMEIGELNSGNAGLTGKSYPQNIAYKRAYDRAVLTHLGLFVCYGDSENPGFAHNADYEAEEEGMRAAPTKPKVSSGEWKKQPDSVRDLVVALIQDHKYPRSKVDAHYVACNGDADTLEALLTKKLADAKSGRLNAGGGLFDDEEADDA